jgi:hypothetical protein
VYTSDRQLARRKPAASAKLKGFTIDKRNRFWQVTDSQGQLVCITVYKRGAKEVVRRLSG